MKLRYLFWVLVLATIIAGHLDARTSGQQIPQAYPGNAASYQIGLSTGVNFVFAHTFFSYVQAQAGSTPLPTELVGVQVKIEGEPAPLFFVSYVQINFLVADKWAGKRVSLDVFRNGILNHHTSYVVSPTFGVFTANSRGFGSPAGLIFSPATNSFRSVSDRVTFQPLPLPTSTAGSQNYLILFATGLGNRQTVAVIDGNEYPVSFCGPSPNLTGVEQVNIPLSAGLADKGLVDLWLKSEGARSNTTKVYFE